MTFVFKDPGYEGQAYDGEGYESEEFEEYDGGYSLGGYPMGGYGTVAGAKHNSWIQFLEKHAGKGYSRAQLSKLYKTQKGAGKVKTRKAPKRKRNTNLSKIYGRIESSGAPKGKVRSTYNLLKKETKKNVNQLLKDPELTKLLKSAVSKAKKLTPAKLRKLIHGGAMGGFSFGDVFDVVKTVAPFVAPLLL